MKKTILILFLVLASPAIADRDAFYPFDLGMHSGMSTGGGTGAGAIFSFKDTGGVAFKDTAGIAFKDY